MEIISSGEMLENLNGENAFIGSTPEMSRTEIIFRGKGNVLFCESGVKLVDSSIVFNGNNSIVYLCKNKHEYYLSVTMNNNNVFYMGKNNYINGKLNVILSEEKHCFFGNDCLLSFGIWVRNADPHLIYDSKSNKRINFSKSIFVGDHVWIGQSAMLMKGTKIDSGSIVGALGVVAGKRIFQNESWGGNPCRKISESIFWENSCVHKWDSEDTKKSIDFAEYAQIRGVNTDAFKYEYDAECTISYEELDEIFTKKSVEEKIDYLKKISTQYHKNRFVHKPEEPLKKKRLLKRFLSRFRGLNT